MPRKYNFLSAFSLVAALVCMPGVPVRGGDIVLNFSDVPPGTLTVFNPYMSQGFTLTSTQRRLRLQQSRYRQRLVPSR